MRALSVMVISLVCTLPAYGQAKDPDDLQPRVNTSDTAARASTAAPAAAQPGSSAPAAQARTAAKAAAPAAGKVAKAGKAMDRIELDTTDITGNKELPKVMYVVPWKRADLGDLTGKPANSLVDEVLQPVDRDVFNREERYYHTVAPQKGAPEAPAAAPAAH
ncbi:MAG TPA: hypothetical protein VMF03_04210 [Steroidobacteraceae bacterium]|nr:hypothetical protein [Steroidobacteraceae bacterium]